MLGGVGFLWDGREEARSPCFFFPVDVGIYGFMEYTWESLEERVFFLFGVGDLGRGDGDMMFFLIQPFVVWRVVFTGRCRFWMVLCVQRI